QGSPGADITFFEYPGAQPGRAGAGMVHTVVWRVGSEEALEFWRERMGSVPFEDPEGMRHDIVVATVPDQPLIADHPEIPRERALAAGGRPTEVIDRFWFRSVYFREPSGVLYEIATKGPGFSTDEDMEHLGEKLILPPAFEHLRAQVEPMLTPLPNPRAARA